MFTQDSSTVCGVCTLYIDILNTAKDGNMDGWMNAGHQDMQLSDDQVFNLQLVASGRREQLLPSRRGGGAVETEEPAGALSAVSGCQSGRGRMINVRCTCVLVGLMPALRDAPRWRWQELAGLIKVHKYDKTPSRKSKGEIPELVCLLPLTYSATSHNFL